MSERAFDLRSHIMFRIFLSVIMPFEWGFTPYYPLLPREDIASIRRTNVLP